MASRTLITVIWLAGLMAGSATAQGMQPGGDPPDAHGCVASTGATYSILKKTCVEMWDVGIQLTPLKPQGMATYAAYVIFAHGHDGGRAELLLYDHKGGLILDRVGGFWSSRWTGEGFTLTRQKGVYGLTGPDGQLIYQSKDR